jgi:AraC-like DNA-binding protein
MFDNPISALLDGGGMVFRCPVERLRPFLGCFWSIRATPDTSVQTFPDGSAFLAVEFVNGTSPRAILIGPRLKPSRASTNGADELLGARLQPGVVFALLDVPAHELVERREPLRLYLASDAGELEERLGCAGTTQERFDVLESFLLAKLANVRLDDRVSNALALIAESAGSIRISELARNCGVGPRQLERLMRQWVGLSPKRMARIARFQATLGCVTLQPPPDWTEVAAEQGYFDQAQLIHEFADLAGATPRRLISGRNGDSVTARCNSISRTSSAPQ